MDTNVKHTPAPYQRMLAMTCDGEITWHTIMQVLKSPGISGDTKEFIKNAVNSHDELLAAMRLATHHLYATAENAKAINILLEAIAKANGK